MQIIYANIGIEEIKVSIYSTAYCGHLDGKVVGYRKLLLSILHISVINL